VTLLALLACAPEPNNLPPELVTSTYADGATIEIPLVGVDVQVTASDPESDPLEFTWAVGGMNSSGTTTENTSSTTSTYVLTGEGLDGLTLSCSISDGAEATELSWPLVYTGG